MAITVVSLTLAFAVGAPASAATAKSDAAHACAQGGYAGLQGTDGTRFENTGECVSYVARGGTIINVTTSCAYAAGTSGCVVLDDVFVGIGSPPGSGTVGTTLAGMLTFAPVTTWDFEPAASIAVSGSGTWSATSGASGTWTATTSSSIYFTRFYVAGDIATWTTCALADTRYVAVHFDVYEEGALVGTMELQLRDATWGTDYVVYQGFSATGSGEPWGIHSTPNVSGVTLRC